MELLLLHTLSAQRCMLLLFWRPFPGLGITGNTSEGMFTIHLNLPPVHATLHQKVGFGRLLEAPLAWSRSGPKRTFCHMQRTMFSKIIDHVGSLHVNPPDMKRLLVKSLHDKALTS